MAQEMKIKLVFFFMLNACYASYNAKIVEELKSNTGDVSLSINIPSLALSDILGGRKTNSETRENIKASNESANAEEKEEKSEAKGSKSLDLAKLLSSGKPVSIKSTETSTMGEKGNTEKSVKEIAIDTLGDSEAKSNTKGDMQFDEKTMAKMIPALKQALMNSNNNNNNNNNNNSSSSSIENNIAEIKANPSSGLSEDKTSKAAESPKEGKEIKSKEKGAEESKELKGKEKGTEVSAAESKPASSEGTRPSKQNSLTSQIALLPVSLPSSVLAQLQSAISGNQNNGGNMSANSGNSTGNGNLLPGLASLLGNNMNNNNNNATSEKEMAGGNKNETTGAASASAFNETTSSMSNSSNADSEGQEGAKLNKKKENGDKYSEGKPAASQSEMSSNEAKPMKKDTPVLVVIPQITNTARDLTETKSGFFSKKAASSRIRSGLHKKSKVQNTSHKKSKVHKHHQKV